MHTSWLKKFIKYTINRRNSLTTQAQHLYILTMTQNVYNSHKNNNLAYLRKIYGNRLSIFFIHYFDTSVCQVPTDLFSLQFTNVAFPDFDKAGSTFSFDVWAARAAAAAAVAVGGEDEMGICAGRKE